MKAHHRIASLAMVALAGAALAAPASADFGPTRILRTADEVRLLDVAAKGSAVGVVWQEYPAGDPAIMVRISRDGGATFDPRVRLDARPNKDASAVICRGTLWIASALQAPDVPADRWDIIVDGRSLDGSGSSGSLLTDPFASLTARDPDIACVGNRFLAVTWLEKASGSPWHAQLRVFDPHPPIDAMHAAGGSYGEQVDLGTAMRDVAPAIDATNSRVAVLRGQSGNVVLQRFTVAPGEFVSVAPLFPRTISSDPDHALDVAIAGSRVVVAYTRDNDLFTRRSTNGGASFSSPVKRLDGDATCCFISYPSSLDIVGSKVLLLAARAYGDLDTFVEQWRFKSSNGGATFSRSKVGTKGERLGAFRGSAGSPRIVEAWDDWADWQGPNRIRFHRES